MNAPGLSLDAFRALGRALLDVTALPGRHIGAQLRELVILHVSSINGCPVCSSMHGAVARRIGVPEEDVDAARRCEPSPALDERTQIALRYAELRTLGRERRDAEALERFQRNFSHYEQREVRAITDLFTFNNRFNNAWERLMPGARERREKLGLCERPL